MCEVTKECNRPGVYWVQTNLPAMVAEVREGEHNIRPDRNVMACGVHLATAVRSIRKVGQDAILRIVGNVHTGWKGVVVKMRNGKAWQ